MRLAMVALLLVLAVGTAFAFTPGMLTIGGTVNIIQGDYVRWNNATVSPSALTLGTSNANIVDARDRTAQHIEWEVEFHHGGTFTLYLTAINDHATLAAAVAAPTLVYDALVAGDHGLTVTHNFGTLVGTLPSGATSPAGSWIAVTWDGVTLPGGFDDNADNPVFTFSVTLVYTAIVE